MEVRILGRLEVVNGADAVSLGGPRQRMVLASLLLRRNRPVSQDQLIDDVWGESPPPAARNSLQSYISHLRSTLGPERLEGGSRGYVLKLAVEELDAARFEALVQEARRHAATDSPAAVSIYQEALGLWQGPVLDDLSGQPFLQPEIARLEELRLVAIEERLAAELSIGRHREVTPELQDLVRRHPLRERLWAELMVALYGSGRQAEALEAYRRARELLAEELGLDPSPELRRLEGQILRQDPVLELGGKPIRGYRLLERLGEGAFGVVHRAVQPDLGREVAVKVIRPALANDPEFIRRFGAEAQFVARLEHPQIVPLFDFWREPDGAYFVMRYLRGGSLRDALAHGPLEPERAVDVVGQVAAALAAAHRQGVVHRDVKPANILFDEDGNAYLSDFGIAKDLAAAEVAGRGGTPSSLAYYLSPEEARGEAVTPRADIYSLGLLLFESLAGRHPFADTPPDAVVDRHARETTPPIRALRPELPAAIEEVIGRATAKDPADRYADAVIMANAAREALAAGIGAVRAAPPEARNPYKGLRPFAEADSGDFFGRDALVDELVARMREHAEGARFLSVVGPSGSGKSSAVRAGLVPALRRGAISGSDRWFIVELHPGTHPFQELATALTRIAVDPVPGLVERLEAGEAGLLRAADEILGEERSELLVVIDQFEEVFTLVADEDLRVSFLASLVRSAIDPRSRVRVVVSLRADFYDRPLSYPGLAELVKARTVTVTPLSPEELQQAVSSPAERVGLTVEPALLTEVASDVAAQPGALPLLQFALTELFDHRRAGTLTAEAYHRIGGVSGSLVRRADELYGSLDERGQEAARQLFLRLVTLGEEGSEDTRRRVLRSELGSVEVDPEAMQAAIDAFGARRLLSFDRDPLTRGPTVEVAHEALLREWGRLRGWIEAAREDVRTHRRLATAAKEWSESGRDPSYLLRGVHLARFEAWAATSGLALSADEREHLEASLAQRAADRAEQEARRAREAALERRSRVWLRSLVAVFAVAAVVAGGLAVFAFDQRGRAEREARIAAARELAAAAVANLDVDPERSILLALEAVDSTLEADGTVLREAEEALRRALRRSRVVRSIPQGGYGLAVSSDGTRFVTAGSDPTDDTATVWDAETGQKLLELVGPGGPPAVAFSPDDRLVATTHNDGSVRIWDAAAGRELQILRGHEGPVTHPVFSPDGTLLATGGQDQTVRIWDLASGSEERKLAGDSVTPKPAFSPDGSRLAVVREERTLSIWDLARRRPAVTLSGHEFPVNYAAFSPDGSRVATAGSDGTAKIWDAESGAELLTLTTPSLVFAVAYSRDGTRVATGGGDAVARVWDAETGRELLTLAGHGGDVVNVAFSPDGSRLITSSRDDTTRVWDITAGGAREWLTVPGVTDIFAGVAFSPDGSRFAAPAEPSGVTIWDTATGEEVRTLTGHEPKLTTVAFSPDGRKLAAGSDVTVTPPVWDLETGKLLFKLTGHDQDVRAIAFSPDGDRLATGGSDGTAKVWDARTGAEQGTIEPAAGPVFAVAYSPEGRFILTGSQNGEVGVWDTATLERVKTITGHTDAVEGIAFGPGGMLATASGDTTAKLWDFESGQERVTLRGHSAFVSGVAVSPDGSRIATASDDGTAKLWDATTGRELLTLRSHDKLVFGVAFSPDGRLLATASPDGTVALHLLSMDELRDLARERATRTLTEEECRQYLHLDACP